MNEQHDSTFGNADTSDVPADFFERPVRVAEFQWEIGSSLFQTINPWQLYFEEPRVANKMAHFRNLRCSLRLKFVLNGNPFYFGRAIASAQPLPFLDNITKFEDGTRADFIQASQRPHVYLNPTTCEGGELVLPFFFYKNTLDITRAEWRDMGVVTLASLNPLRHANNAPEPVTISVFAMAENVNVSTPTSVVFPDILPQSEEVPIESESKVCVCTRCLRAVIAALSSSSACTPARSETIVDEDSFIKWVKSNQNDDPDRVRIRDGIVPDTIISMSPQAGEEPAGDEYGMVSAPAHQIANLAGDLSNAPVIGPYARATQLIASGVGKMAQLFGFSRPRIVEEPCSYLPRHAGHLAVTNVPDNIASLAIDAKKEVTVDGRVVGLDGADEMALVPIACRESYLTTFDWSTTDNPNDPLYSQRITPLMFDVNGADYHLTPSAWTQIPFQYWKGSVELRFKIVCSEYHRGRIRIVWDPLYFSSAYSDVYNVNYTEVIDISETRDFSVRIGWGQQTSYLPCGLMRDLTDLINPRALYEDTNFNCNGAISVLVVNQLTTPASTDPIEINVYTKMCEDYEVAVPECLNLVDLEINDVPADFAGDGPIGGPDPPDPPPAFEAGTGNDFFNSGTDTALLRIGGSQSNAGEFGGFLATRLQPHPTYPGLAYTSEIELPTNTPAGSYPVTVTFDAFFKTPPYGVTTPVNLQVRASDGTTVLGTLNSTIGDIRDEINDSLSFNLDFDGSSGKFLVHDLDLGTGIDHEFGRVSVKNVDYPYPSDWDTIRYSVNNYTGWSVVKGGTRQETIGTDAVGTPYIEVTTPFVLETDGPLTATSGFVSVYMDIPNPADVGKSLRMNGQDVFTREPENTAPRDVNMYTCNVTGIIGTDARITINTLETTNYPVRIYGMIMTTQAVVPESGEEMLQDSEADEANAPIKQNTEMYMAPVSDSGQINSVHFGERITSWRQMLKRYNDVLRFTSDGNTNLILHDAEIDDPAFAGIYPGFIVNPEMPLMRWVRSGYLARRGSIRYKIFVSAPNDQLKTASMGRVCLLDRAVGMVDGLAVADVGRVSHAGSTFANISETGVIDAEVPFYTNLRFQPARIFQDYVENPDRGKEFTWFQMNMFSENNANVVDVTQAASEDLSFHFFLSTPIVNLKPLT